MSAGRKRAAGAILQVRQKSGKSLSISTVNRGKEQIKSIAWENTAKLPGKQESF